MSHTSGHFSKLQKCKIKHNYINNPLTLWIKKELNHPKLSTKTILFKNVKHKLNSQNDIYTIDY